MKVIDAVHDDEVELSLKDMRGTGKRNGRLAAAAASGCVMADSTRTPLYWTLADCSTSRSRTSMWCHPDLAVVRAVMDPDAELTIADVARSRFQEEALVLVTKRDSVQALWRLRSGLAQIPIFDLSTFRDVFFGGSALHQRLDPVVRQLGLTTEDVRKPSHFRRRKR